MSVIHHEVGIGAAPEAVFELMARVKAFAAYSEAIESITRVRPDRYRWHVRVAGVLPPSRRGCSADARWRGCPARAATG